MVKEAPQDLRIKTRQTKKLKLKAAQIREGIRQNVIAKGYVHFRVSSAFYTLLFEIADAKQVPLGILCRQWVAERAQQELSHASPEKHSLNTKISHGSLSMPDIYSLAKRIDKLEVRLQRMR